MKSPIPYYNNITESFQGSQIMPSSPDFELIRFEDIPIKHNVAEKPFRLNAYVIGVVTGGSASLTINSKTYKLQKGSLYFSNPWHVRQYKDVDKWEGFVMIFTPVYLHHYRVGENMLKEFPFFHSESGTVTDLSKPEMLEVHDLFEQMHKILHSEEEDRYKILFHYLNILLFTCKPINQQKPTAGVFNENISSQFSEQLNNYFVQLYKGAENEPLNLKMVSRQMHLHPNYLSNLLKVQTGKSAAQLIRERMILEAKSLLTTTSMTISEIAYYLHFKDTSNFAKFFKSHSEKSPSQFREAHKEGFAKANAYSY